MKRTAESMLSVHTFVQSSASRTPKGLPASPALKRWAIVILSASRTKKSTFEGKADFRNSRACEESFW